MKSKFLLLGACACALASGVKAADVDITITGATAFRNATMQAIVNAYNSVGAVGATWNVAHDFNAANSSQLLASNRAVFSGTFPGVTGVTTIRTSWNGSTEGLRAVAQGDVQPSYRPTFLTTGAFSGTTDAFGYYSSKTTPTEQIQPKFSFSDVRQTTSPITSPVLNPADARVGVVTFTMLANEGAPVEWTNVTTQQFKAMLQQGIQPLKLFTGVAAQTDLVFLTGRNDGSGTRSTYLAEVGHGVANPVQQYVATVAGAATADVLTAIVRVPAAGSVGSAGYSTVGGTANKSDLWGITANGNGGYSSGSTLRDHMARTTASVDVFDPELEDDTTPLYDNIKLHLLTFLSTADARTAVTNGAKLLSFNGVGVTPISTGFNAADKAKITTGQYSAWGYQQLYYRGSLTTDQNTVYQGIKTNLPAAIASTANGLTLADMTTGGGASRPDDGAPIVDPY